MYKFDITKIKGEILMRKYTSFQWFNSSEMGPFWACSLVLVRLYEKKPGKRQMMKLLISEVIDGCGYWVKVYTGHIWKSSNDNSRDKFAVKYVREFRERKDSDLYNELQTISYEREDNENLFRDRLIELEPISEKTHLHPLVEGFTDIKLYVEEGFSMIIVLWPRNISHHICITKEGNIELDGQRDVLTQHTKPFKFDPNKDYTDKEYEEIYDKNWRFDSYHLDYLFV